jgi:hypothetical protein
VWMHTLKFSSLFENFKNYDRVIGLLIAEEYAAAETIFYILSDTVAYVCIMFAHEMPRS